MRIITSNNPIRQICYLILPQGVTHDLDEGLKTLAENHAVTLVLLEQVDWNDDLTPWPAPGVFRKAKPFGGKSRDFLERLISKIIPEVEDSLQIQEAKRSLLGVSLSGLFAIWAGFNTEAFNNIISISGSLWYDGFTEWMREQSLSEKVEKVCLLLGDREKNSKEKRMATVEQNTLIAAEFLKTQCQGTVSFELVEGTHFSPIFPRMEKAFSIIFG
jgi:predicted alpha/beta superfamily hydrolase